LSKYIAIELDPQGIFAVHGSAKSGHAIVDLAVAWDGTDGEPPPPLTADTAKAIGEQLRDRLKAAGVVPAPVLVSIPRDRVILKELRYPAVPPTDEPNVVKFQAMKELTDAPEDVVLDYVPLAGGSTEGERRSMAVAVRKELLTSILTLCTAANLKLAAVTPRPYGVAAGLNRAFATGAAPRPEEKSNPHAILTLSPGGGEFTVIRPGSASGSNDATFSRTISPHSMASETSLLVEVRRNLTMYAGANPEHPIQALYVAEPEGRRVNQLKNALGIPVHAYDPLAGLASTIPPDSHRGRFAGAAGLLAARAFDELPINFQVPRQPKVKRDANQKQMLITAGVAFLLVVGGLLYGMSLVSDAELKLAKLQQEKRELEDDATKLEPDYKRLQAAKVWKSRRVVWLDMLYDISDQFQHNDGMLATSYDAKAVAPDTKTGKQDAQAQVTIRLTSRSTEPVNALMDAMYADNKANPDPKTIFYAGVEFTRGGSPQNDPSAREYTVSARVTTRPADQFKRFPPFSPPSRRNYPPAVAAPAQRKELEPKDTDTESGEKDPKAKVGDPKQAPSPNEKVTPKKVIVLDPDDDGE
jgi:hypothetical protein